MSLLEDVFLEDEAGEAQELERVIEGDEYDERPVYQSSDENEEKEDEAEEDKRRVDPTQAKTKRVVKNPRFILNPARLTGPRGIQVIPDHFKDFKFKGKGHEKEDLDMVLKKLEHWAYRLYPKFEFSDCLKKIETLGKKRPVMVHLHKIRHDEITSEETVVQKDSSDDEDTAPPPPQEDEFDKLLQQQIELARSTPMSVKKTPFATPSADRSTLMPKATSSPSINEEQRERMLRNRRLAEERRLAKLKENNENNDKPIQISQVVEDSNSIHDEVVVKPQNRSNVIDSSSDDDEMSVKESVAVELHNDTRPHVKSSVIDSSDEKEPIAVELHSNARPNNRSNVIESSDDDEMSVKESVAVELHNNSRPHNRSNVIDSSSSSDDEMTVNESVTVELHNNAVEENIDSKNIDENAGAEKPVPEENTNNVSAKNNEVKQDNEVTVEDNDKKMESDNTEQTLVDKEIVDSNVEINIDKETDKEDQCIAEDNFTVIDNNTTQPEIIATKDKTLETPSETPVKDNLSKISTKENDIGDEIMDVDFDDEF